MPEGGRIGWDVRRVADAALLVWCVLWAAAGVWVWSEVRALRGLSDAGQQAGIGVRSTAEALGAIGSVPLVGDDFARAREEIARAGEEITRESRSAGEGIPETAVVLGLAVGLAPTVPLLVVYGPGGVRARLRRPDGAAAA